MPIIYKKDDVEKEVEIEDIDEKILRCEDLIKLLQGMNPKAVCLVSHDGDDRSMPYPKEVSLKSINGENKYCPAYYIVNETWDQTDDDSTYLYPTPGRDAILF